MYPRFPPASALARLAEFFAPEYRNISSLLRRQAESLRDRPFITIGDRTYTCDDISVRAGRMADLLRRAGVAAGDRVGILCGNRIEFLDLFFACAWLNAIAVPINRSSRGPQLHHILRNSGARLLVIEAEIADTLLHIETDGLALTDVWLLPSQDAGACEKFADWRCRPMPTPERYIDPATCSPADTAAIIYTSGTTGPSKGVCCPHEQFFWWGGTRHRCVGNHCRRRATDDTPAIPYQCTGCSVPGLVERRISGRARTFLGKWICIVSARSQSNADLFARRHGADPAVDAGKQCGSHAPRSPRACSRCSDKFPIGIRHTLRDRSHRGIWLDRN